MTTVLSSATKRFVAAFAVGTLAACPLIAAAGSAFASTLPPLSPAGAWGCKVRAVVKGAPVFLDGNIKNVSSSAVVGLATGVALFTRNGLGGGGAQGYGGTNDVYSGVSELTASTKLGSSLVAAAATNGGGANPSSSITLVRSVVNSGAMALTTSPVSFPPAGAVASRDMPIDVAPEPSALVSAGSLLGMIGGALVAGRRRG